MSGCEHEMHQSLINNQLVTVMDCRNRSETGETDRRLLRIPAGCVCSQGQSLKLEEEKEHKFKRDIFQPQVTFAPVVLNVSSQLSKHL